MNNQDIAGTRILRTVLGLLSVLGVIIVLWGGWGFEENSTLWDWLKLAILPAVIATLPVWLIYREKKPIHCYLVLVVLAFLLTMVAIGGYWWHWEWTGIVPKNVPGKKRTDLWDWLEVVLVPFVLPIVSASAADRLRKRAGSEETSRSAAPISAFAPIAVLSIPLAAMAVALALTVGRDAAAVPNSPPVPAPMAPAPTAPQPEPLRVPATQKWTPTEISVTRGERLKITARGEVRPNIQTGNLVVGPDGDPGPQRPEFNVLPGEKHHAALIGRIDGVDSDTGKPFLIGREYTQIMDRSGVLVLGVNDTGVENNSGEFTVNVVVTP